MIYYININVTGTYVCKLPRPLDPLFRFLDSYQHNGLQYEYKQTRILYEYEKQDGTKNNYQLLEPMDPNWLHHLTPTYPQALSGVMFHQLES